MATNGVRASSVASSSEQSLVGASGYKFKGGDKKSGKIRLKKLAVQIKKEKEVNGIKDGGASSAESSPIIPQFDDETMANFPTGKQEPLETVICKHCKKVVLKRTAKDHVAGCLKSKQEKARKKKEAREAAQRAKERAERGDDDEEEEDDIRDGKGARKSAVNGDDDGTKKGKKRKADDDEKEPNKKKKSKKDEQKPKQVKFKGPVDVEKQCGVLLPNAAQCARSLTCKSHSMGAKRAVGGRSLPYDMLLAAYQKKNQARQQKAAIESATLPPEEDIDPALTGPVDSDEERDAMMNAISRSRPLAQPLVSHTLFPTRRKYQLVRMKEMLSNALNANRSGGLFSVSQETARSAYSAAAGNDFAMPQTITPSPATTGIGMAQPGLKTAARKASVVEVG